MERVVKQRLSWLLKTTGVLSEVMSGFRQYRTTADSISDEDVRTTRYPACMVILDLCYAFDAPSHDAIILHFPQMLRYLRSFLTNGSLWDRVGGYLSRPCPVAQSVPQGVVLSALHFILSLAGL